MSDIPYPGLRPFTRKESDIFFGREEHTDQLLEKLSHTRFISVVGLSGCGKSSLVRAGMIAALESGHMASAGTYWRVAAMRPGNRPLRNLATALLTALKSFKFTDQAFVKLRKESIPEDILAKLESLNNQEEIPEEEFVTVLEAVIGKEQTVRYKALILKHAVSLAAWHGSSETPEAETAPDVEQLSQFIASHGPLGLVEVLRKTPFPRRTNVLILVDQFEEIFRYHRQGGRNEAETFVALLLTSVEQREAPVYVVTTMRSDFIGDCALFRGLPEMMNAAQFLAPRLTHKQRRKAIIRPARVFGGTLEPRLVNRLLNEMGTDPDQLPVLQHCLMRLWLRAKPGADSIEKETKLITGEPSGIDGVTMTLEGYEAVGGLENALSNHADEAFAELDEKGQWVAEIMFRRLSERGADLRDTRHPVPLREVVTVADVSTSEAAEVVEVFRRPDRCLLTPTAGIPLESDSMLDISHESLIRQWRRMNEWVEQEAESAETYQRLEKTALRWKQGKAALWSTPDLDVALKWKEQEKPTAEWAHRYGKNFELAMEFLDASAQAQEKKCRQEELERQREEERRLQEQREQQEKRLQQERERRKELQLKQVRLQRKMLAVGSVILVVVLFILLTAFLAIFNLLNETKKAKAKAESGELRAQRAQQIAQEQKQRALEAQNKAERQTRLARSSQLAAQARTTFLEHYPQRSLLLAIEALNVTLQKGEPRVPFAEEVLREALANIGGRSLNLLKERIADMALSPDGRWLVITSEGEPPQLWKLNAHNLPVGPIILKGPKSPESSSKTIAMSSDSHWLVTGSQDGIIWLWDLSKSVPTSKPKVLIGHKERISTVVMSPDNRWLVTGSYDNTARLWDLQVKDPAAASIVLHGHQGPVSRMTISPDSHWLVTNSGDGIAFLWNLASNNPAADPITLYGHEKGIRALAISPDSRWLVTGSEDFSARLWNLTINNLTVPPFVLHGHKAMIKTVAFSADNRWLVTGSYDGAVQMWDLHASNPAENFIVFQAPEEQIIDIAVSPDNHWLLTYSEEASSEAVYYEDTNSTGGTIRLWDLAASNLVAKANDLLGNKNEIKAFSISPDGHWLITGNREGTISLWDLTASNPTATPLVLRGHEGPVDHIAISSDSRWLVTGSEDGTSRLWDLTVSDQFVTPLVLHGHKEGISSLAISSDNRWLVTGSWDATVRVWDLTVNDPDVASLVLRGHEDGITTMAISPDQHWLVTGSEDATGRLWDLRAEDLTANSTILHGHEESILSVAVSPDSRWLVTGSEDATARLWDLTAEDPAANPIILRGHEWGIYTLAISPDNHWLVTGSEDGSARLWDLTADDPTVSSLVLRGHEVGVSTLVISPDNRWLITGSWDTTARVWDLMADDPTSTSTVLHEHEGEIWSMAISPDSRWLVTGSEDTTARVWDLTADDPTTTAIVLRGHDKSVQRVVISSDGRWLVTSSLDKTARLWDLTAEDPAATSVVLRGHKGWVNVATVSPDGRWLVTGSEDGTARLWMLRLDELIKLACRTAGRNLSSIEWENYFQGEEYRQTCPEFPAYRSVSRKEKN